MKKILLLVTLLPSLIYAQSFQIKQITNLDADCRNLSCTGRIEYYNDVGFYTFEAHIGNTSSIYFGQYFAPADSFAVFTQVTNDNFMNINPKLIYSNDSVFIVYQTNKNGNWNIVYRIYFNNQLSPVYYVADSSLDETNPIVSTTVGMYYSYLQNQFVSYEKGNSVFIRDVHIPNSVETEVFHGNDSTKYTQVSLEGYPGYFNISARKVVNGKSFIVYKPYSSNGWSDEIILVNTGTCRNPKILSNHWAPSLSYTDDINGKSNVILIENFSKPIDTLKLFDYPLYNYDNFWALTPMIYTKIKDFYNFVPYSYTASRNDSLFIRVNKLDMVYGQSDTLLYTKVNNNNLYMVSFGYSGSYEDHYTFWEDSSSGHIQIFGKRYLYPVSGIKDSYSPSAFTLYQNYPNPFNPGTVINFKLLHWDKITLNVYDIMGRQVCSLLNEDKPAGEYTIKFDSKKYHLSSGIYFYRLITGEYSSVKKMILMK